MSATKKRKDVRECEAPLCTNTDDRLYKFPNRDAKPDVFRAWTRWVKLRVSTEV